MNLSYCWYRNDEPIVSGDRIHITGDDSTSTLKLKNVQASSAEGSYMCKISNPTDGSVKTEPVRLTAGMHSNCNVYF